MDKLFNMIKTMIISVLILTTTTFGVGKVLSTVEARTTVNESPTQEEGIKPLAVKATSSSSKKSSSSSKKTSSSSKKSSSSSKKTSSSSKKSSSSSKKTSSSSKKSSSSSKKSSSSSKKSSSSSKKSSSSSKKSSSSSKKSSSSSKKSSSSSKVTVKSSSSSTKESSTSVNDAKDEENQEDELEIPDNYITVQNINTKALYSNEPYMVVSRVVAQEIGNGSPEHAIKAQAVATNTMIATQLAKGKVPQVPMREPTQSTINYVKEVIDKHIYYNGKMIESVVYFASSGGRTQDAKDVWGNPVPYLVAVDSPYDTDNRYGNVINVPYIISSTKMQKCLEDTIGATVDGDPKDWFEILSYTSGEYVDKMLIGDTETTGRKFRETVLNFSLRSCKIVDIKYDEESDNFAIYTLGWGHGAGMSQIGTIGFAKNGHTYDQILTHYYTGTVIK